MSNLISINKISSLCGIPSERLSEYVRCGFLIPDVRREQSCPKYLFLESRAEEIQNYFSNGTHGMVPQTDSGKQYLEKSRIVWREKMSSLWKNSEKRRVTHRLRTRIWKALTRNKGTRTPKKTISLVGCSIPELRKHFESKFEHGMTWENYGIGGWTIDHIIPCSLFDLSQVSHQKLCFHYTKLRPLWDIENRKKGHRPK